MYTVLSLHPKYCVTVLLRISFFVAAQMLPRGYISLQDNNWYRYLKVDTQESSASLLIKIRNGIPKKKMETAFTTSGLDESSSVSFHFSQYPISWDRLVHVERQRRNLSSQRKLTELCTGMARRTSVRRPCWHLLVR